MTVVYDVITLGACFHVISMFVYIRARFRFTLIGGNLTAQSTRSHRGIGGVIQIPETYLQAFLPFPARTPRRACSQACLVPVRRFHSPYRSIHCGDVSESNGRETPHVSAWTTRPETLWPRGIMRSRD